MLLMLVAGLDLWAHPSTVLVITGMLIFGLISGPPLRQNPPQNTQPRSLTPTPHLHLSIYDHNLNENFTSLLP